MTETLKNIKIGFALCGSFCTFAKAFDILQQLVDLGADVTGIMSFNARNISTRFGGAEENTEIIKKITGKPVICTIEEAEPIGPNHMFDILVVANCTGNTLAKLASSIIDTPVTMAVKSHIRNARPTLISVATNDALAGSAKNIGALLNYRNFYFVPLSQDDFLKKPTSVISDFDKIPLSIISALNGKQIQPILV